VGWIFDHSSCHGIFTEDALIAQRMNAHPGGKQHLMRDTVWQGRVQKMVFSIGVAKGLIQILKERGVPWGAFFLDSSHKVITKSRFVTWIRDILCSIGLPQHNFASHSFCTGAATTAAASWY
jgi:hypothetical protein